MNLVNKLVGGAEFYPYQIDQSCRFNDDDSAYLHWTPGGAGTEEIFTLSTWIKRCNLTSIMQLFNAAAGNELQFTAANKLQFTTASAALLTTQVFRDVGSWMHIVLGVDTTQGTAANRVSLEINGVAITDFDTETYPNLNEVTEFSKAAAHHISSNEGGTEEFDGYQVEVIYLDGLKVAASSFGQSKFGMWIPKKYTGSYGTNGFYLDFADSADLGNDVSGNNNDFTSSGLAANDQVLDSPTNNYPTLSSINKSLSTTLANGNLTPIQAAASWQTSLATMQLPKTGKFYFEFTLGSDVQNAIVGVQHPQDSGQIITGATYPGEDTFGWGLYTDGSFYDKIYDDTPVELTGKTPAVDDVMQVAIDIDVGKIWFGVDNTWLSSGDPGAGTNEAYSGITGDLVPAVALYQITDAVGVNFGQLGFAHTPPIGFLALNSANLTDPTVLDSSEGFDVVTYEGTGAEKAITDLEFSPDLVWIKNRDAADGHVLTDSVRGVTKELNSDSTNAESTAAQGVKAFSSSGFTLGTNDWYNTNGESFVAWCFQMGAKYGFDIQTYEGTGSAHAENHDLGGVPELMIVKNLDNGAANWEVYHHHALNKTDPETDYGRLNITAAWADVNTIWHDTAPTSTQFTISTSGSVNENGSDHVAYLWRSIPQFSKVFSYEGNGNVDGTFVYCGFRPRYILIKDADGVYDWYLFDKERDTYNPVAQVLYPSLPNTEVDTTASLDFLSNGFKLRITNAAINANAHTYVGIAYAELPGKYSNAR